MNETGALKKGALNAGNPVTLSKVQSLVVLGGSMLLGKGLSLDVQRMCCRVTF